MSTRNLKDLIALLMNFAISTGLTYLILSYLGTIFTGMAGLLLMPFIPLIWIIFVCIVWGSWHYLNEAFHIV